MKNSNKLFSLIALVGMALSFSSCTKCVTCKYTDPSGILTINNETCGNKADSDANKSACEDEAANFGGTCECSTKFTL